MEETDPQSGEESGEARASGLLAEAERAVSFGQTGLAEARLREAGDALGALPGGGDIELRRRVGALLAALGDAALGQGALDAALEKYRGAHGVAAGLVDEAPTAPALRRDMAFAGFRLGTAELARGDAATALPRFQEGADALTALSEAEPDHVGLKRDRSAALSMLGDASAESGRLRDADEAYGQALAIAEDVDGDDSRNLAAQAYLATLHRRLAGVRLKLGATDAALANLGAQAGVLEAFRKADAADDAMLRELIDAYRRIAEHAPSAAAKALTAAASACGDLQDGAGKRQLSAALRDALARAPGAEAS